ncbi:MAG TPA: carbohydrate kinase family protein [Patescibacteria group bacterium]|nr:carbohydrate kinase family protein [Patescibacteria group bacterium]
MKAFDVVTVGGATVDLFLLIDPQNPHLKFNSDTNELSIRLGDKVVLENSKLTVGGNANNVAVGLKRLGFNTALMAEIGNDEFALEIAKTLKKEGVDSSLIKKGESPSSFSVILNYNEDRTIFTRKVEKKHDFNFQRLKTEWIYLTSMGVKWEEAYKKVGDYIQKTGTKLVFNPGGTQIDGGLESYSFILKLTEVLIVNRQEGERIVNDEGLIINDLLFKLKRLGPKVVVVTDGDKGSYAINDKGEVFDHEVIRVKVVSKTGAGDAYASGFLAAISSNKNIKEAMTWGTKNAASVIKLIGAQAGLMTLEQIQK